MGSTSSPREGSALPMSEQATARDKMEIPSSVRDLLCGLLETFSPENEARLARLQEVHDRFLVLMEGFQEQAMAADLSIMRPDVRMKYHQLRVQMFQEWRVKMSACIVASSPSLNDEEDAFAALKACLEKYTQTISQFLSTPPP